MSKKFNLFLVSLITIGFIAVSLAYSLAAPSAEKMDRKIVVFKSGILNEPAREALIAKFGGVNLKHLNLINGTAVLLPPKAVNALVKEAGVQSIENDIEVSALRPKIARTSKPQPLEILPWGIERIKANLAWGVTTGNPIKVGVIDTGIDVKHPDLIDNLKGGVSAVGYTLSYNDDNGHGTHVAGITAAIDNEIGVIGVGPQIDLYAIKVLDRRGSGYLSDVIEGLDWAIQSGMQVVNMSLGTGAYSAVFEEAIKKVNAAGIVQVAAAGNAYGGAVSYPAKFAEVIAVSATDSNNQIAYFSSIGPEVDLAAPGVSIYSTYKGQTYKSLSGTSMAAPHVAGAAALVLDTVVGLYDENLNGYWDPAEVQKKLQDKAFDLGALEFDNLYGWGLVDAEASVK